MTIRKSYKIKDHKVVKKLKQKKTKQLVVPYWSLCKSLSLRIQLKK